MREDRAWMYNVTLPDGQGWNEDFFEGVENFLTFATTKVAYMNGDKIRCPCSKCANMKCNDLDTCRNHLYISGFTENYHTWIFHGEPLQQIHCPSETVEEKGSDEELNACQPPKQNTTSRFHIIDSESAEKAGSSNFLEVLQAAHQPLWNGHTHHSQLSTALRLVDLKYEHNLSEATMDSFIDLMRESLPTDNNLPSNTCNVEKLLKDLGLSLKDNDEESEEIDEDSSENDTNSEDDEDSCETEIDDDDDYL